MADVDDLLTKAIERLAQARGIARLLMIADAPEDIASDATWGLVDLIECAAGYVGDAQLTARAERKAENL